MITFLTLFLGLVFGPQEVAVRVGPEVARVELRLDGEPIAELTGPSWRVSVDFGPELVPGRLEAVALDSEGREVGRTVQRLNLPRPSAELDVSVDSTAEGTVARFRWEDVLGRAAQRVVVAVDGVAVTSRPDPDGRGGSAELPPFDPALPHVLRVEIDLDDGTHLRRETAFGGGVVEVFEELTAVPFRRTGDRADDTMPTVGLVHRSETLASLALEDGDAVVYLVPAPGARDALRQMVSEWFERRPAPRFGGSATVLDRFGVLGDGTVLRILEPVALRRSSSHVSFEVFPVSPPDPSEGVGVNWIERLVAGGSSDSGAFEGAEPIGRLADAVAVAGLRAAADQRRRAVVVLTAGGSDDAGRLRPGQVRRYLARLGVPLVVWDLGAGDRRQGGGAVPGFDADRTLREMGDLRRATGSLDDLLAAQRILWLAGTHRLADLRIGGSGWEMLASNPEVPEGATTQVVAGGTLEDALRAARREAAMRKPTLPTRLRAARRTLGPTFSGEARDWGGFRVWTDVAEGRTGRLAAAVASGVTGYTALHGDPADTAAPAGDDHHLVLFAEAESYRRFAGLEGPTAVPLAERSWLGHAGDDGVAALPLLADDDEAVALLLHEAAHLLNRRRLAGRTVAPWLEEGLAEALAFSHVGKSGAVRVDRPSGDVRRAPEAHPRLQRVQVTGALAALGRLTQAEALPSLAALTGASRETFHAPEERRLRYDQAAYLVRWAALEHGADWRRFLDAVAAGVSADLDALASYLGILPDRLEREFADWLRGEARRRGL